MNRVLTTLKAALNYGHTETKRIASDAAWIGVKPFRNVDLPKIRFLTPVEATALVSRVHGPFTPREGRIEHPR